MSVGFPVAKVDIDNTLAQISLQLRNSIMAVTVLQGKVSAMTDADLTNLGYGTADITLLRAAVSDLYTIQQIAYGLIAQTTPYDFRTNISQVTGIA